MQIQTGLFNSICRHWLNFGKIVLSTILVIITKHLFYLGHWNVSIKCFNLTLTLNLNWIEIFKKTKQDKKISANLLGSFV